MQLRTLLILVTGPFVMAGCGGVSSPRQPSSQPPLPAAASSQALYEAGRYQEVTARYASAPPDAPREVWFAARSYLGLGRSDEARAAFDRLASIGDDAWRAAARLATAVLSADAAAIDAARAASAAHPGHPFVQYELGMALLTRGSPVDAAAAFDRSVNADPGLAYAYYYAGLAYQRLDRADLMASRFETFLRLAPAAPERAEVQALMTTIRGR